MQSEPAAILPLVMVWIPVHLFDSRRRLYAGYFPGEVLVSVTVNIGDLGSYVTQCAQMKELYKEHIALKYGYKRYYGDNPVLVRTP